MNQNEQLKSVESNAAPRIEHEEASVTLSLTHVERTFAERSRMLESLQGSLPPALQEAIGIKIDRERSLLLEMVEKDARDAAANNKPGTILNEAFFTKKPFTKDRF